MHHGRAVSGRWSLASLVGALSVVVSLAGCVQTGEIAPPGPGHPAFASEGRAAYSPPENVFRRKLGPAGVDQAPATPPAVEQGRMPGKGRAGDAHGGVVVYGCPMHIDVRSDRPGACPKCGMALVPLGAHDHQRGGNP